MARTYPNVPSIRSVLLDGGLQVTDAEVGKRVLVLGTAAKGPITPYRVTSPELAKVLFGTDGSLIRGLHEVMASGHQNIWLMAIGHTVGYIDGLGDTSKATLYFKEAEDKVKDYTVYYGSYTGAIKVWNDEGVLIYNSANGLDYGLVEVSGTPVGGVDIGTSSVGVAVSDIFTDFDSGGNTYALTDVQEPSSGSYATPTKRELYEYLHVAYESLIGYRFDRIVPMDVYADDYSIAFINPGDTVAGIDIDPAATDLPSELQSKVLGWLHTYKNTEGEWVFTWADDLTATGANTWADSDARLAATVVGTDVVGYHEVDFAYQLAQFCYDMSSNDNECSGVIGVNAPASYTKTGVYRWIGVLPTYDPESVELPYDVTANGTGLCGLPYTVGCLNTSRNVLCRGSGSTFYPGYFSTDTGFPDGAIEADTGGYNIDIGKYLDIFGPWFKFLNGWSRTQIGYSDTGAAWYAGFQLLRPSYDGATNKLIGTNVVIPFIVTKGQLNDLVTARITFTQVKDRGAVICAADTAAMLDSDWIARSTTATIQDLITGVRNIGDPYVGNGYNRNRRVALQTALTEYFNTLKGVAIADYTFVIRERVIRATLGALDIELTVKPINEIREITVTVGMTAKNLSE